MARYDRDEVLARVDLAALADSLLGAQHPRTRTWRCPNPQHTQTGRTPPVSIFSDRRGGQRYHCFGCGEGGTAIDLTIRAGPARDFRDALEWLAHRANVSPQPDGKPAPARVRLGPRPAPRSPPPAAPPPTGPDASARQALSAYAEGCVEHLHSPAGLEVRRWLTETRGLPPHLLDHAGVGADPGQWKLPRPDGIPKVSPAAVFPIRHNDEIVFTLSRVVRPVGNLPRWLNTATSIAPNPRIAYLEPPGPHSAGPVVVTEGMVDALSALSAGRPAVALLGTGIIDDALAERLAHLRRPLVLATDNDDAGRHARNRLAGLLSSRGIGVAVLPLPERFNDLNDWHVVTREQWQQTLTAAVRLSHAGLSQGVAPPSLG